MQEHDHRALLAFLSIQATRGVAVKVHKDRHTACEFTISQINTPLLSSTHLAYLSKCTRTVIVLAISKSHR